MKNLLCPVNFQDKSTANTSITQAGPAASQANISLPADDLGHGRGTGKRDTSNLILFFLFCASLGKDRPCPSLQGTRYIQGRLLLVLPGLPLLDNVWKAAISLDVHSVAENIQVERGLTNCRSQASRKKLKRMASQTFCLVLLPHPFHGNSSNRLLKIRDLTILSKSSIAQQHLLSNSEKSFCSFSENKRHVKVISHRHSQERRGASLVVVVIPSLVANPCLHQG